MRTMHLFAGAGGGLLGDLILGHTPVVAVEWDAYACQVLRERAADGWFPGLHVWEGDVRLFDPSEYAGSVDCIHAGFPCTDLSVAGKQAGLGEGTRSGLYREVIRIAGVVRPQYIFLENVSAILSNGLGSVLGDLAAMGYDARWLCLRASDVGAPHHRDRWWCLATMADTICERAGGIGGEVDPDRRRGAGRDEQALRQAYGADGANRIDAASTTSADVADTQHDGQSAAKGGYSRDEQDARGPQKPRGAIELARSGTQPGLSADVADTDDTVSQARRGYGVGESQPPEPPACDGREYVPDAKRHGLQGIGAWDAEGQAGLCRGARGDEEQDFCHTSSAGFSDGAGEPIGRPGTEQEFERPGGWQIERPLGGMADELSDRLHDSQAFQGWWTQEPDIGRVTTGCDNRASQLKALGNAQVPLQAAVAWRLLGGE